MKILQLGKFYPCHGGVEAVMLDLLKGLSKRNIDCDMLCTHITPGEKASTYNINTRSHVFCAKSIMKKYATMISPNMIFWLRQIANDYNIIHIHHPDPMAAVALLLSNYKGKVVLHWHSDIIKQKKLLYLYKPIQNWLLRRASIIVGTTPVYVEQSNSLKRVQDKCTYVPIGIMPMSWDAESVNSIRERFQGKHIVFSLGRLVHYKGFKYLIDAARFLPDDYVVLIGGKGPLKKELEEQISEYKLSGKVHLLGRVSDKDLPNYYRAADIYCLSSIQKTEAFAIVQIEAMSCSRPVIATNIPGSGVQWVNADGVSGINVPICNSHALADAIIKVISNPSLYKKLSSGAYERYTSLFTQDLMIEKCIKIYNKILNSNT